MLVYVNIDVSENKRITCLDLRFHWSCSLYRSGTLNLNTVNSKFHLIRSFFEIFARFLSFHVKNARLI